jgi:hypothetical protein
MFPSAIFLCHAPSYEAAAPHITMRRPKKIEKGKNERSNYAALILRSDIEEATTFATLAAFA